MRVLLTGGAGYIGSHTAVELLRRGHEVVVADNLANSDRESLRRVEVITGITVNFNIVDMTDAVQVENLLAKSHIDAVVHFAGFKAVGESVVNPLEYYRNNLDSTLVLLEGMARNSIKKLVFSSSATVYEEPSSLPVAESAAVGLDVSNPYGRTKAMNERILMDVAASDDSLQVAILRYFNPVGAHESGLIGEDPQDVPNNLMPYVSQVAVGLRDHVSVFGSGYDTPDGTGVRDYIHVMDLASGHAAALENLSPGAEAFNLGTGRGSTVLEVIDTYARVSGRPIPYEICDARPGDVASSVADVRKAERQFNWRASRTLEEACRDAWRWQSTNPEGYSTRRGSGDADRVGRQQECR
jgi:UDP-glucose 4-epimerase